MEGPLPRLPRHRLSMTRQIDTDATTHIFGIRHHGPGSARSLRQALAMVQPDIVLVEGPPDAADVLPLMVHADMQPPVALLIYRPDQPRFAVFYPFAIFSPEWQAFHYALTNTIPVRCMDLAQTHQLALQQVAKQESSEDSDDSYDTATDTRTETPTPETTPTPPAADESASLPPPHTDPLRWLAEASGYSDSERWWEHMVEQRRSSTDLFAAILEAMTALRDELPPSDDPREAQREAAMRQAIRAAQREGYRTIAVVCGAWHAPALATMPSVKHDQELLKGLPKVKVQATWVPWTYGRLTFASGYGAGIESPGWYHHLWTAGDQVVIRWMSHVARLLREQDLDASSAHIIEAVRLAEALAAMRERPLPGLPELNEAVQATLCFGSDLPLRLISERLIVGDRMGTVPDETPMVPLQKDVQQVQKRLRMPAKAAQQTYDLDLRKPIDLERSHLLHRLNLLDVPWGEHQQRHSTSSTFHEYWQVQWKPELEIRLIEASIWGTTIEGAATARACDVATHAPDLPTLTAMVDRALLAHLPAAMSHLVACLQAQSALTSDVSHLMESLPPLARVMRYGSVRAIDTTSVAGVVDSLVVRMCIGLPGACASLDDDAAAAMVERLGAVTYALTLLDIAEHQRSWHAVLLTLADQHNAHGLLAGRCCRMLLDAGMLSNDEVARRMGLACSPANEPAAVAAWIEGFLKGSGLILLHDDTLWNILDRWVTSVSSDTFVAVLPLLRRTFATFAAPERRQMGERVRGHRRQHAATDAPWEATLDSEQAQAILPTIGQLLGMKNEVTL